MSETHESTSEVDVNGVNAATGGYLTDPLDLKDVIRLAKGESIDPNLLSDLKRRNEREEAHFAPIPVSDENNLAETGWGVVFCNDADPAVRDALKELLDFRKSQAGQVKERFYREFSADKGYLRADPQETKRAFLRRNGAAAGMPADPEKVPYYLMLVGDPGSIPYRFQYQLDVEFAVGRIWFEKDGKPDLEAFARYAKSVVDAESGHVSLPRTASFVGVRNDDDRATSLSAGDLVKPLADTLSAKYKDWSIKTHFDVAARKDGFSRLLGGAETPTFLFTASHGIGFPNNHPRQLSHQGALLCQDWPGPRLWRQEIGPDFYYSADDVGDDAKLLGLIAFHFACYGAGTPELDDFAHLKNLPNRDTIAPNPFIAQLPQRLLSHPRGGALAVIGHIERAWGCSFYGSGRLGRQLQTFQGTITRLLGGERVGWALEYFNQLHAAVGAELADELNEIRFNKIPDDLALSEMWTSNIDARGFVVIGDPAVRLPLARQGVSPGERRSIGPVSVVARPAEGGPVPKAASGTGNGAASAGMTTSGPGSDGTAPPAAAAHEPATSFAAQINDAEDRFRSRESERNYEGLSFGTGGEALLQKNDPERIRRRLAGIGMSPAEIDGFLSGGLESFAVIPGAAAATTKALALERILGRNDMVGSRFLDAGARAARPVGRVRIRSASGGSLGFGTGSLIGPRLLLTNNHVLDRVETARASVVEFNVQDGLDGTPLTPTAFALAPDEFFLTDAALDFTLVAVAPAGSSGVGLGEFGWNPARADDDPVLVEEFVNIIQHPSGQPKQVALRDNKVIDLLTDFVHYKADTEPGSSGAPVFNDQWQLVALHHSGVPRRDDQGNILARDGAVWTAEMSEREIDWIANEGARLSRILRFVKDSPMSYPTQSFKDELFATLPSTGSAARPQDGESSADEAAASRPTPAISGGVAGQPEVGGVTVSIPLKIHVSLGTPTAVTVTTDVPAQPSTTALEIPPSVSPLTEAVTIDPQYGNREGYDPDFLGAAALWIPLPKLSAALAADAARVIEAEAGAHPFELKYHHFSVILHSKRRFAIVTAVNIDGKSARAIKRETDKWFFDPRVGRDEQVGDDFYPRNAFDRGHLVRRLDPAWGRTERVAKVANDDTFHFTNSSAQHEKFNQGKNLWAGLEDYLLNRAVDDRKRLTVFTGPVYDTTDPVYRGVQVPRQFWKVAVTARPNGRLAALAFLVSQADLLTTAVLKEAAVDVARTFQVKISRVEELTGLDFGSLKKFEGGTVEGFGREAAEVRELDSLDDIRFPTDASTGGTSGAGPESFSAATSTPAAGPTDPVSGTNLGYYLLAYDSDLGERSASAAGRVADALGREPVTDVFFFSHGWRGDVPAAREQYTGWIRSMAGQRDDIDRLRQARPNFSPLLIGLHWPSEPWGDENIDAAEVSFNVAAGADRLIDDYARRLGDSPEVRRQLRTIIEAAQASGEPDHLPPDMADAYRALDRTLGLGAEGVAAAPGADREPFDPDAVYQETMAEAAGHVSYGLGLPGIDTLLSPLRTLSFWTMKDRARRFGEGAVHPLLVRLLNQTAGEDVRFHLMGHSFGCIVASAAVAGPQGSALPRPVDSLSLVQGAFSIWSYCPDNPFARGKPGYFHRIVAEGRVRGPILTTQSRFDSAVGTWYPRAAWAGGQVAFAAGELPKYGAVGCFGLQGAGLNLLNEPMRLANVVYDFQPGQIVNLESSQYINLGGGFSGAHSDIRKPEVAHAMWQAITF